MNCELCKIEIIKKENHNKCYENEIRIKRINKLKNVILV